MGKIGPSILTIGSINTDMVVKTIHLPAPGQTVLSEKFINNPGDIFNGAQASAPSRTELEISEEIKH